ncbi:hypothetical protein [Streptomyces microflavus]
MPLYADGPAGGIRRLLDHLGTEGIGTALLTLSVPTHRTTPAQETR